SASQATEGAWLKANRPAKCKQASRATSSFSTVAAQSANRSPTFTAARQHSLSTSKSQVRRQQATTNSRFNRVSPRGFANRRRVAGSVAESHSLGVMGVLGSREGLHLASTTGPRSKGLPPNTQFSSRGRRNDSESGRAVVRLRSDRAASSALLRSV